jgi:predicted DNA-binding antitoxin AbrB/MazE fold protein
MRQVLEAVYEQGVLRPLQKPELAEHQRVWIELRDTPAASVDARRELEAWGEVYAGLTEEEIAKVESIALDRSHFLTRKP